MRFVDNTRLRVTSKWKTDAGDALSEARSKRTHKQRADYINSRSRLWSDLKPKLEGLSNGKCWYCEAREIRSDRAVDHYRPKNNVRASKPHHRGYWWLAFDPLNYRLSCTYCNSRRSDRGTGVVGGKGDYFPLADEKDRLKPESRDFRREGALLLDPCKATDVSLLWYEDDGRVRPKYGKTEKPLAFERADKSIYYYNLNEREIKDKRQALYTTIKELVDDGDTYFEDSFQGVAAADHGLQQVVKRLAAMTKMDAEYSAFAIATIKGFRGGPQREWIDNIELV